MGDPGSDRVGRSVPHRMTTLAKLGLALAAIALTGLIVTSIF